MRTPFFNAHHSPVGAFASIYSPVQAVPDPAKASAARMKAALVPAVFVEIELDNRQGKEGRRVFFAFVKGTGT